MYPWRKFNVKDDVETLQSAMAGLGTDEDSLIEILCKRSYDQRMEIVQEFKNHLKKNLIEEIEDETDGNFRKVLVALLTPKIEFYTNQLYEALHGKGTDEDALYDMMPALSNQEVREVSALYKQRYRKTLGQKLHSDTSSAFQRLMVLLAEGDRDETFVTNPKNATADAQVLKSTCDACNVDDIPFIQILCKRNFEQIKLIAEEFARLSGFTLDNEIKSKFSGDIQRGLKSILRFALNPHAFYASRLYKAFSGVGTNDKSLIRIVVMRAEIDMLDIKDEYQKLYGVSLRSAISGDTSDDFKYALYALVGERRR